MFGCVLLFDEIATSFTWLFKAFLESMRNQQPKTIIIDQDVVMVKATEEVMPNTCNRSHLVSLNSYHRFQSLLNKCMKDFENFKAPEMGW